MRVRFTGILKVRRREVAEQRVSLRIALDTTVRVQENGTASGEIAFPRAGTNDFHETESDRDRRPSSRTRLRSSK
jgi:hypothetical protein